MTKENGPATYQSPSKQQILKATAVALGVALVIFLTTVLPAEYGIDPLHTGKALGLMSLSKATPAQVATTEASMFRRANRCDGAGRRRRSSRDQGRSSWRSRRATRWTPAS